MANNTAGSTWWKQAVEWGSDLFDDVYDWGSSFLNTTPEVPTAGLGNRPITLPTDNVRLQASGGKGDGFNWWESTWETAKKYGGYIDDYLIDPARKVLGYGKDIYEALPKSVQDAIMGVDGRPEGKDRPRAKPGSLRADMSSTVRQIGRGRTGKFNPQNLYSKNSPTGNAMYQALSQAEIREAMLKQINTGNKTISLAQAKDIYTYLSRRG